MEQLESKDKSMTRSIKNDFKTNLRKNKFLGPLICFGLGFALGVFISIIIFEQNEEDKLGEIISTSVEAVEKEGFLIHTPFVDLYYPKRWENQVRIEQIEGDEYVIQFFATVENKGEIHLFDLVFGGENGDVLGYLEDDNKDMLPINIISYDIELGEEWTKDEENEIINGMLSDINYIIGMLQKEEDFTPAV